jgi:hypothetical protein
LLERFRLWVGKKRSARSDPMSAVPPTEGIYSAITPA